MRTGGSRRARVHDARDQMFLGFLTEHYCVR
jgi:hypothetical protein